MHIFAPKGVGLISKNSPLAMVDESVFNLKEIISENQNIKVDTDVVLVFEKTGLTIQMLNESVSSIHDNGRYTVIIVKYGDIFKYDNKIYYVRSNEIYASTNLDEVISFKETKNRIVKKLSKEEQNALAWLDNGDKGVSSLSICYFLFPNLRKHSAFLGTSLKAPLDIDALSRCVKFFDAIPDAKFRINELKEISKEWNYIVNKWDELEKAIKNKNIEFILETFKKIDKI